MASAGHAHAHSSQPMHFSRPSGRRLSWCLTWKRGSVARFSSGYWTVSTLWNICRKVTAKPLTGLRKSSTGDLRNARWRGFSVTRGKLVRRRTLSQDAVIVRQVHRRDGGSLARLRRVPGFPGRIVSDPAPGRHGHDENPNQGRRPNTPAPHVKEPHT